MQETIKSTEQMRYIKIEKDLIPYFFTYDYKGNIFEFDIRYNSEFDFFTTDLYLLYNEEKITLILGEKIILNQMLFMSLVYLNIDIPRLIPYDFAGNSKQAGYDEMDYIYLVVMEDDTI